MLDLDMLFYSLIIFIYYSVSGVYFLAKVMNPGFIFEHNSTTL